MLLFFLILVPFLSGIISWQAGYVSELLPRWCALLGMIITFILSLSLLGKNNEGCSSCILQEGVMCSHWITEYTLSWIPRLGISFHLALDGLSLLMVVLSTSLGVLSVLCSWTEIKRQQGFFYFNLLWLISCVIAVFLSIDMFFFFLFWEMMIFPMYLLISFWGRKRSSSSVRIKASLKFFIYTQISGLIMLVSILMLVVVNYNTSGILTFDYIDLLYTKLPSDLEYILMLGFFVAFSIKLPIVPFHGWLSDAHSQAPTAGSVDLSGILLKTAAYGLFRFNLTLFPNASQDFSFIGMCLGTISIFYSAWLAFSQTDIKRLMAYSSVSHMGFVLLSVYSGNLLAYQGAVIYMLSHALSSSGMFILSGQLFERLHVKDTRFMGGLWDKLYLIPGLSLFFSICMISLPGTGNFTGEAMILFGSFQSYPIFTSIAAFGIIFASIYSLILIQRIYYGMPNLGYHILCESIPQLTFRERLTVFSLLFSILFLGVFPQFIMNISFVSMNNIYQHFIQSIVYPFIIT